jgi:hypothetical protein
VSIPALGMTASPDPSFSGHVQLAAESIANLYLFQPNTSS